MRISVYLLRREVPFSQDCLSEPSQFHQVRVRPPEDFDHEGPVDWELFVRSAPPKQAAWVSSVRPIALDDTHLDGLTSQSTGGVLLVRVVGRVFAVTFGNGFHAIPAEAIEPTFGLRVAANIIESGDVTSADTKGLGLSARSQKTILPAPRTFYELGVEPLEEWVRQLGGKVAAADLATTASGADSLRLTIKNFSLPDLPRKLSEIYDAYGRDDYKRNFGFIDHYVRLNRKDPVVAELDGRVRTMVGAEDSRISFAAPDPFEQLHVASYRLKYRKACDIDDLTTEAVYGAIGQLSRCADKPGKVLVTAHDVDGKDVDRPYKLYDYVQVELTHDDGHLYALRSGVWFRIDKDHLREIDAYLRQLPDITDSLVLPEWDVAALEAAGDDKTAEGSYNKMVAKQPGFVLLDKDNVHWGRHRKIEVCDLLTDRKQLICVKRATQSSALSHLFAQASVSASLMFDPVYQKKLRSHWSRLGTSQKFDGVGEWVFVYAIATDRVGVLVDSLFFFSKVNLRNHAQAIQQRGFGVAVARILVR